MNVYIVIEKVNDKAESRQHICYVFNEVEGAIKYVEHIRATSSAIVFIEEYPLYSGIIIS